MVMTTAIGHILFGKINAFLFFLLDFRAFPPAITLTNAEKMSWLIINWLRKIAYTGKQKTLDPLITYSKDWETELSYTKSHIDKK